MAASDVSVGLGDDASFQVTIKNRRLSHYNSDSGAETTKVSAEDFNLLKVLGKGSFGKVMLVRKKSDGPDGELFAMKTLQKAMLLKRNQLEHTKTERNVLKEFHHPFMVNMRYAFQTQNKLFMVLEYVPCCCCC